MAKIMLVEDDNNLREIYGARLQAEGHEVVSAQDGEAALALAVKEKPDLIISDVMMPRISGFDMLDILRNAPETKNTKVIMMTALSQVEDRTRAEKLGADRYLVKSQATLEDVVATVNDVLGVGQPASDNTVPSSTSPEPTTQAPAPSPSPESQPPQPSVVAQPQPEMPAQPSINVEAPPEPAQVAESPISPSISDQSTPAPTNDLSTPASMPTDTAPQMSQPTEVEAQVAQPLDSAQSNSPADNQPLAQPTKIEVVEPPSELAQPAAPPEVVLPTPPSEVQPETASETPPNPQSTPPEPSIGPNVDDILAQESSSVGVTPNPADNTDGDAPKSPLEETSHEKIINPINDPTQTPDLNELLKKEEEKENTNTSQAPQTPQASQSNTPPNNIDPNNIAL